MIKYELRKSIDEIPVKYKSKIAPGITQNSDVVHDIDSWLIASYDNKQEALEALKKYRTTIYRQGAFYWIEEYFVEEIAYDEDGDFDMSFDWGIIDVTPMPDFE